MLPKTECVMGEAQDFDVKKAKCAARWATGAVCNGMTTQTDEHTFLTEKRVMATSCVNIFAEGKQMWNTSVLDKVHGLPWVPNMDDGPPPVARCTRP